jgi:hypothetical protein
VKEIMFMPWEYGKGQAATRETETEKKMWYSRLCGMARWVRRRCDCEIVRWEWDKVWDGIHEVGPGVESPRAMEQEEEEEDEEKNRWGCRPRAIMWAVEYSSMRRGWSGRWLPWNFTTPMRLGLGRLLDA